MTDPRGWPCAKVDGTCILQLALTAAAPQPGLKWILWAAVLLRWEFTATVINRRKFGRIPYLYKNETANLAINFLLCLSRAQVTDIHVQYTQMCRAPWSFVRSEVESYKSRWYWLCPCYIWQLLLISSIFLFFRSDDFSLRPSACLFCITWKYITVARDDSCVSISTDHSTDPALAFARRLCRLPNIVLAKLKTER